MGAAPAPGGAAAGLGCSYFETMTPLVAGTYPAARAAVDVALTAADLVLDGAGASFGLCRPPGHHAPRAAYGGYCYFNNAAVVADEIVARTGTKVTVLDVDYHHGNGTQQIFYERDDVQYVSLHGDPEPGLPVLRRLRGRAGVRPGSGRDREPAASRRAPMTRAYLGALADTLDAIDRFDPATLVVSLGVDTFHLDPIADFALSTDGFALAGALVAGARAAQCHHSRRAATTSATIGENVRTWLAAFDDAAAV